MNQTRPLRFFNPYADDPHSFRRLALTVQMVTLVTVLGITFFVSVKFVTLAVAAALAVAILFSLARILWPGQILTPLAILLISAVFVHQGRGIHDIAIVGLVGGVIVAGLLLGARGLLWFGAIALLVFLGYGVAEITGIYSPISPEETFTEDLFIFSLIFIAILLTLGALINRLGNIAMRARQNELAQIAANEELLQLKGSLETRVAERTVELERRAAQMETIASTARSITAMRDLEALLPFICRAISERFGFYHTGVFLIDERGEYAVLQAANSPGGQRMLEHGHRLRVGATGIVGAVAGQGQARIALDVGADAVYFDNPDLPETRSELALPLQIGGQTIGVLDVQSRETGAFKEEDITVLGILADQVTIAIENARLFSQTKQALADSQAVYQQYVRQDWARFSRGLQHSGYLYDGIRTVPLDAASPSPAPQALTIPILVRGLTVGNVVIQSNNPLRAWSQDEINLARAAAERAGLAIENYRLLTEAQRRASKERAIGEIAARIGASVDVREIMQAAVEELGRILPNAEVILQFQEQQPPAPFADNAGRDTG